MNRSPLYRFWLSLPFWALASGLFLNAYVYGVAASALTWIPRTHQAITWLMLWSPLWLTLGIGLGGTLADHIGRRKLLLISPLFYVTGGVALFTSSTTVTAFGASASFMLGAGMESNTILVFAQELLPTRFRRQALYAELNFVNLGGLVLAALAYLQGVFHVNTVRRGMALVPLVLVITAYLIRLRLNESRLWQRDRVRRSRVHLSRDFWLRFVVSALFSFSNTTGFSLLTYAYGAEFFPHYFRHFLLLSTLTAFSIGLGARYLARFSAKRILATSYGAAFGLAIILWRVPSPGTAVFWMVLLLLSAATSVSYLAEDTFKASHWSSRVRGRITGAVRISGLTLYMAVLVATRNMSGADFLLTTAGVWSLGFMASLVWLMTHGQRRNLSKL